MRDPERIESTLELISNIWKKYPDLRLMQLIGNCFKIGDLYHVEEDELVEKLKENYGNL